MPKKGFTLVELLVVIAIIVILSLVGLSLYTDALGSGRDAKRRQDIDTISQALEQHFQVGVASPYLPPDPTWFKDNSIPQDPQGSSYYWNGSTDGACATPKTPAAGFSSSVQSYTVCAKLESKSGNGNSSNCTYTSATGANATYYCAKNLR